jgi:succinoglycan biosynthesis protein ExoO
VKRRDDGIPAGGDPEADADDVNAPRERRDEEAERLELDGRRQGRQSMLRQHDLHARQRAWQSQRGSSRLRCDVDPQPRLETDERCQQRRHDLGIRKREQGEGDKRTRPDDDVEEEVEKRTKLGRRPANTRELSVETVEEESGLEQQRAGDETFVRERCDGEARKDRAHERDPHRRHERQSGEPWEKANRDRIDGEDGPPCVQRLCAAGRRRRCSGVYPGPPLPPRPGRHAGGPHARASIERSCTINFIVSVIIPAYNAEDSLPQAIDSALAQTFCDLEVIVIDDFSADKTLDIAVAFEHSSEGRVRILKNDSNVGPGESRNRGISVATGDWIAFLDADDKWLPERLQKLSMYFPDADVVSDDLRVERAGRSTASFLRSRGVKLAGSVQLRAIDMASYHLGPLKPVIRTSFLREHQLRFDPSLRVGEDFTLFVELLLAGARWTLSPDAYYVYTRSHDSLTSDTRRHVEGSIQFNVALLGRPEVRADPELLALIEHRERWLRDFEQLLDALELARQRRWGALGGRLTSDRRTTVTLLRTAARHAYHKLVRYRRRRPELRPARPDVDTTSPPERP